MIVLSTLKETPDERLGREVVAAVENGLFWRPPRGRSRRVLMEDEELSPRMCLNGLIIQIEETNR